MSPLETFQRLRQIRLTIKGLGFEVRELDIIPRDKRAPEHQSNVDDLKYEIDKLKLVRDKIADKHGFVALIEQMTSWQLYILFLVVCYIAGMSYLIFS